MCGESFDSAKSRGGHRRWNHTNPWEEREKVYQKYVVERKSIPTIADEWDCGSTTIEQAIHNHGIKMRDRGEGDGDEPWKDEETLQTEYVENKKSTIDLANEWGCSPSTINDSLRKFGIDRWGEVASINGTNTMRSYSFLHHREDGVNYYLRIHRLVAYSRGMLSSDELFSRDPPVHHKNGIGWINSPENLEVLTASEHIKRHIYDF